MLKWMGSLLLAAVAQAATYQIPVDATFGLQDDGIKESRNGGLTIASTGTAVHPGTDIDGVKVWGVFTIDPIFDSELESMVLTGTYFAFAESGEAFTLPAGVTIPVSFLFDITGPGAWETWTVRFVLQQAETQEVFEQTFGPTGGSGTREFSGSGAIPNVAGGSYVGWRMEIQSGDLNESGGELERLVINVPESSLDILGMSLTETPEPGTAFAVGVGLVALGLVGRRKRTR